MSTIVKNTTSEHITFFARLFASYKAKRRTTEIYFNSLDKSKISNLLEKKDFRQLSCINVQEHGTKMVIVMSRDHNYASIQLFDYIPYKYVESSPLYEFTGSNAANLFTELHGKLL